MYIMEIQCTGFKDSSTRHKQGHYLKICNHPENTVIFYCCKCCNRGDPKWNAKTFAPPCYEWWGVKETITFKCGECGHLGGPKCCVRTDCGLVDDIGWKIHPAHVYWPSS